MNIEIIGRYFMKSRMKEFVIREEKEEDYFAISHLITESFASASHKDGKEAHLVEEIRKTKAYLSSLSLVAIVDDEIIGYIMFSKVEVGESIQLALAPLAVLPSYQRKGIGSALIEEGHRRANKLPYSYSIVLGDPGYYKCFGYQEAKSFGIKSPFLVPSSYYLAYPLKKTPAEIKGIVRYSSPFYE